MGKIIIISAPSGAGKTSIVQYLLKKTSNIQFSISACSREKRSNEIDGKDYYFLEDEQFQKKIKENAFLEWEEVYPNQFYGTLKKEVERLWSKGNVVIFDLDVLGAINIKRLYPNDSLSIFIMPPSVEILRERLIKRGSESEKTLKNRIAKAKKEISKSHEFDEIVLNNDFQRACKEALRIVKRFIII